LANIEAEIHYFVTCALHAVCSQPHVPTILSGKNSPFAIVQEEDLTADLEEKKVLPLPGTGV
jgi:hypothetical protein